jgi:YVTN family beta-propeller protein
LKAFALPRTLCNIFLRNDNFPGALIVTADRDDNQISIIDAKTFVRKGTVKVGAHPFGVTIDPQGARLYGECRKQRRVRRRSQGGQAAWRRGGR